MNNGTKILELQNLDSNKRLLMAQRQTYTDAKKVDAATAAVCLGLPLVVTLVQVFSQISYQHIVAFDLFICVAGFVLAARSSMLVRLAARIQQEFDANVFGIKFENTLRDTSVISRYAKKYMKKNDDLSDLEHWYTAPIEGLGPKKAISLCQRQNAKWTSRLMGRYLVAEFLLAVVVCASPILLALHRGVELSSLWFLLPVAQWMLVQLAKGALTWYQAGKLVRDIPGYQLTSYENIIAVQQRIFDYRAVAFLVPNWFYKWFKSSDNEQSIV